MHHFAVRCSARCSAVELSPCSPTKTCRAVKRIPPPIANLHFSPFCSAFHPLPATSAAAPSLPSSTGPHWYWHLAWGAKLGAQGGWHMSHSKPSITTIPNTSQAMRPELAIAALAAKKGVWWGNTEHSQQMRSEKRTSEAFRAKLASTNRFAATDEVLLVIFLRY
jgi:hypothetical protein